jgi:hypothetical protein
VRSASPLRDVQPWKSMTEAATALFRGAMPSGAS